ncbi:MAG: hypothetical protein R3C15_23610 [Thermoleophilia bacterium]
MRRARVDTGLGPISLPREATVDLSLELLERGADGGRAARLLLQSLRDGTSVALDEAAAAVVVAALPEVARRQPTPDRLFALVDLRDALRSRREAA